MRNQKINKPTDSEMEILQILWEEGACSVRQIHNILSEKKEAGYTNTLKLMQIMFDKGLLLRNDENKTHVYSPAVRKELVQKQMVGKMIRGLFKGSPAKLVMHALGNYRASKEEIDEIKKYLEELENNSSGKKNILKK